jgi:hypothetical protein
METVKVELKINGKIPVKNDRWVKRWEIEGSNGHVWIVAQDKDGNYGCSCPIWKFKRQECHHIIQVKNNPEKNIKEGTTRPAYVLARVFKPTYKSETNELWIPLIAIPDANMMEATICFYLLKYGYSFSEIKDLRRLPSSWTKDAIIDHIQTHGEAQHPEDFYKRGN